MPRALNLLWAYRVPLAGLTAVALAVAGEGLMRTTPGGVAANPELGSHLAQLAVLLVGLVAWVREGFSLHRNVGQAASGGVETAHRPEEDAGPLTGYMGPVAALAPRTYARFGRRGTLLWLAVTAALAVMLGLLLAQSFGNPLAPWVWLAMLITLALAFAHQPAQPAGQTLWPHDPAEPVQEPSMTRAEWLAVGAILLAAILLRIWNLENVPPGPYPDEADRATDARHINNGEPVNGETFVFFGTGWWGVPSAYFWLVAQSLKLFGDTLAGARMVHAIAGIATVWYTYRIGRLVWSPRVGLAAGALLAVSDFAIHISRTAGESTITLFTWTVCFYYLYKALRTGRHLDFVLSGIAAGFTLLGYGSGKLLPVCLAVAAVYLLARWGLVGIKRYLPGLLLVAVAAALVYAPNGLFVLTQKPEALTERSQGISIFSPANQVVMVSTYQTNNWGVILSGQLGLSYGVFDVGQERGPFYPTEQPVLPIVWAALWLLGTAYAVWRVGDARFALILIWLLGGLAGAALTNGTPTLQRAIDMAPLLALVPAIFMDRLIRSTPRISGIRLSRVYSALSGAILAAVVAWLGWQTLSYYFGPYTAQHVNPSGTVAGRYAQALDPAHDFVYHMGTPDLFWDYGSIRFLAGKVQGSDMNNPSEDLPLAGASGKNIHFLVYPKNDIYLPVLQSYYPGGKATAIYNSDGQRFFTVYEVSSQQVDARRQVTARYASAPGPLVERMESRLGTLGGSAADLPPLPASVTFPTSVEWSGGLIVPLYGTYRLSLLAPAGATLEIDGRKLLTAAGADGSEVNVVLAKGVHRVNLTGVEYTASGQVELRWGTTASLMPIDSRFLWRGPQPALLGQFYTTNNTGQNWLTAPAIVNAGAPVAERRDPFLSWRFINPGLFGGSRALAVWKGNLVVPVSGNYGFDVIAKAAVARLWLDGNVVVSSLPDGASANPMPVVTLSAGAHTFEVRFLKTDEDSELTLFWQAPGAERALLPPEIIAPQDGGVWLASERPGVPSPDAGILEVIRR